MNFFLGGGFRLNDSAGQMFELDHTKNRILISNNNLKSNLSTEAVPEETDAERILFDNKNQTLLVSARKILQLNSADKRADTTTGDYSSAVKGSVSWVVDGDVNTEYKKSWISKIEGDLKETIKGSYTSSVSGDNKLVVAGAYDLDATGAAGLKGKAITLTASGDIKLSGAGGQSSLTLSGGKVALKGATGEVVDLLGQIVDAIMQISVPTGVGPSGPPTNAPIFAKIKALLAGMKA